MRAVLVEEWGGPEVLQVKEVPKPEPGEGQVLIKVESAGINFADTHQTENSYLQRYELPLIPGTEVTGTLEDGTRVVALTPGGGYAEYALADKRAVWPIPDGLDDSAVLALLVQGVTAWHLYKTSAQIREGEAVVVISGAGGVGSLAVQLGKSMGAGRVIGTASSEEKRKLVLEMGADAAVDSQAENLAEQLIEANGGDRVDVVLEMAGGTVFEQSMKALAPFGRVVTYGIASREPNEASTGSLMRRSHGVIGFWLMHCIGRPEMMDQPLQELFERTARGELTPQVGGSYPLDDVRKAHEDLKARKTSGKLILQVA
jgi:NADPH2:quinone reductase